jgi:glutamate synthase (NADPH/NADH) small chain
VDVLCEGACVMVRQNRKPIQIALLQRHAMDGFWASGETPPAKAAGAKKLRVACIGGGPASLACAAEICREGGSATVIERRELPGGEMIERLGVEFRCGVDVSTAAALEALEAEFDFIFLGVGLGEMQRMNIPGEDNPGVMNALELIAAYKTGHLRELRGTVVVVGAGNTAIDAANAARRLGAETVYMLYRRSESEISAFDFEYEHAKQEGVQFLWRRQPLGIRPIEGGRLLLDTVQVHQVDGILVAIPDSQFTIDCDLVVPAIGQSPLAQLLEELKGVEMSKGRVVADRATGQTGNPRYFAGGDCVNGGREVVDAVAGGKRAAMAILINADVAHA